MYNILYYNVLKGQIETQEHETRKQAEQAITKLRLEGTVRAQAVVHVTKYKCYKVTPADIPWEDNIWKRC